MSIATLKRKTFQGGNSRISPLSGNSNLGFALNGTLRIGPQIGINLGSSYKDPKNNLKKMCISEDNCLNSNNYVKVSVKNTRAMLSSKNRRVSTLKCCDPPQWVQPINLSYNLQNSQGQYIDNIGRKCFTNDICNNSINAIYNSNELDEYYKKKCETVLKYKNVSQRPLIGWQNRSQSARNYNIVTVSKNPRVAISSSEYLRTGYLSNKCIPIPRTKENALNKKLPFPPNIINSGCNKIYTDQIKAAENNIF